MNDNLTDEQRARALELRNLVARSVGASVVSDMAPAQLHAWRAVEEHALASHTCRPVWRPTTAEEIQPGWEVRSRDHLGAEATWGVAHRQTDEGGWLTESGSLLSCRGDGWAYETTAPSRTRGRRPTTTTHPRSDMATTGRDTLMANEPAGPVYETGRYRKKPVVIEARQLPATASPAEAHAIYQWVEENTLGSFEPLDAIEGRKPWPESGVTIDPRDGRMVIATLEGGHWVAPGDWVIRGVQGEFYPCKSDVFEATYERVADDDMSEPTTEGGLR